MCRGGNPVTCPGGKWISCGYREVDLGVADDEDQVKSVHDYSRALATPIDRVAKRASRGRREFAHTERLFAVATRRAVTGTVNRDYAATRL